jgi:hypothetical protein
MRNPIASLFRKAKGPAFDVKAEPWRPRKPAASRRWRTYSGFVRRKTRSPGFGSVQIICLAAP